MCICINSSLFIGKIYFIYCCSTKEMRSFDLIHQVKCFYVIYKIRDTLSLNPFQKELIYAYKCFYQNFGEFMSFCKHSIITCHLFIDFIRLSNDKSLWSFVISSGKRRLEAIAIRNMSQKICASFRICIIIK